MRPRGMRQNPHRWTFDRREQARRLVVVLAQLRVRRGQDKIEAGGFVGRQVELAVGADVRLDAVEDAKPAAGCSIEAVNLKTLLGGLCHRHATGNFKPIRMIGDGRELVATSLASSGQLRQRGIAWRRPRLALSAKVWLPPVLGLLLSLAEVLTMARNNPDRNRQTQGQNQNRQGQNQEETRQGRSPVDGDSQQNQDGSANWPNDGDDRSEDMDEDLDEQDSTSGTDSGSQPNRRNR